MSSSARLAIHRHHATRPESSGEISRMSQLETDITELF